MKNTSTILLAITLALVPLALWVEKTENKTWNEMLIQSVFSREENKHTPLFADGTFLPPTITKDTTYTAKDNPVILTTTTHIPKDNTITFEKGTHVVVHEHGQLTVQGTLNIAGTKTNPVLLTSNEKHPENISWGGIIFTETGKGNISHAVFEYASPAISCINKSAVNIKNTEILHGNLGIYSESKTCNISDSTIRYVHDGIFTSKNAGKIINTNISALRNNIKEF